MAKRPTVSSITTGHASITALNANFTALKEGFDNSTKKLSSHSKRELAEKGSTIIE